MVIHYDYHEVSFFYLLEWIGAILQKLYMSETDTDWPPAIKTYAISQAFNSCIVNMLRLLQHLRQNDACRKSNIFNIA